VQASHLIKGQGPPSFVGGSGFKIAKKWKWNDSKQKKFFFPLIMDWHLGNFVCGKNLMQIRQFRWAVMSMDCGKLAKEHCNTYFAHPSFQPLLLHQSSSHWLQNTIKNYEPTMA